MIKGNPFIKKYNRCPGSYKKAMFICRLRGKKLHVWYKEIIKVVTLDKFNITENDRKSIVEKIENAVLNNLLAKEYQGKLHLQFAYDGDDFVQNRCSVYLMQEVSILPDGCHGIGFITKPTAEV